MIQFRPFKGVRPAKDKASRVVTRSVDDYNEEEIEKVLQSNPESFLQIIKPTLLPSSESNEKRFEEVRETFENLLENNTLTTDKKSFYIYEQDIDEDNKAYGIIGLVSVDDFLEGKIKKHENTIEKREDTFAEYLYNTEIQAEPVLLTFPENQSIELLFSMASRKTPSLEFMGNDGKEHRLWQVEDRLVMKQLKDAIEKLPALYIADGHHRMSSTAKYALKKREEDPEHFGGEDYNFVMALLIPGNYLMINDYNRLVKDLNGLSEEEFLSQLGEVVEVLEKGEEPYYPTHKHHISMYMNGKFYGLYVKQELRGEPKGLGELDTYLWEENIMKPILGIDNSRTNDRVSFIRGTSDLDGIMNMKDKVDSGKYQVAFGFYPVAVEDLFLVSDEEQTMPPKSTFVKPKLLSGLTMLDCKE